MLRYEAATRIAALWILFIQQVAAQGSAGSSSEQELRSIIDCPTAGLIPHVSLAFDADFFQSGGMLIGASIGVLDRLLFGISYGGSRIIGNESPSWNPSPGVHIKVRIIDEAVVLPAFAIGFNTQGKESYIDDLSRYTIKSMGLYVVASKNYSLLGFFSLHGGVNYSLERADGDRDPNFFIGAEKTLGPIVSLVGEYNLGLNDSNREALGRGRGYVNLGVRVSFWGGFTFGFNLKDVVQNQQQIAIGTRTVVLEYVRQL